MVTGVDQLVVLLETATVGGFKLFQTGKRRNPVNPILDQMGVDQNLTAGEAQVLVFTTSSIANGASHAKPVFVTARARLENKGPS